MGNKGVDMSAEIMQAGNSFMCSGSCFSGDPHEHGELRASVRLGVRLKTFGVTSKMYVRRFSRGFKRELHEIVVVSTVPYGAETWSVRKQ